MDLKNCHALSKETTLIILCFLSSKNTLCPLCVPLRALLLFFFTTRCTKEHTRYTILNTKYLVSYCDFVWTRFYEKKILQAKPQSRKETAKLFCVIKQKIPFASLRLCVKKNIHTKAQETQSFDINF